MIPSGNHNLNGAERTAPENFPNHDQYHYIDIHCHCLPAVDDGPATVTEALALCRALVDDCVTTAIATPHQLGRFSGCNDAEYIREKVSAFNEELKKNDVALTVVPGADVRVDERICQLIEDDKILTLADGGKYILLELAPQVFIDIEPLLIELGSLGVQAIISHPERHPILAAQSNMSLYSRTQSSAFGAPLKWLEHSVHLQITAASLLGRFGPMSQRAAWQFLSAGWASLVATDAHDLHTRGPCMKAAFERISAELGQAVARLVCIENPLRVLKGQDIEVVSLYKYKQVQR